MFVFTLRFIKIIVLGIMKTRKEKEIINERQESTYVKRGKKGGKKKEKKGKKYERNVIGLEILPI